MSQHKLGFLRNLKILYAEDEDVAREHIYSILKYFTDYVYLAKNGKDAWEKYLKVKPDIIITDINMPLMDGLTMAKKIRENDARTRILIVTAYTDKDLLLDATELFLSKYIVKPISRVDLTDGLVKSANELINIGENLEPKINLRENYIFYMNTLELFCEDLEIKLTKKEALLLREFIKSRDKTLTFEIIESRVWENETATIYSIRTIVKLLKKKLYNNAIENIRGIGYKFHI